MTRRNSIGAHRTLGAVALATFMSSVSTLASAQTSAAGPTPQPAAPGQPPAAPPGNATPPVATPAAGTTAAATPAVGTSAVGTAAATAATSETPAAAPNPEAPAQPASPADDQPKAPTPTAEDAAADAAAMAAMQDLEVSAEKEVDEFKLNFYGFADFGYTTYLKKNSFITDKPSFSVGNFNLYTGAELGDGWRMLTEVRFMYLPHGSVSYADMYSGAPAERIDTTVADYTTGNKAIRWGGISIQRAYFEHTFSSWFTARAGQFLTPYGIWNVDHGSPVIIGVRRPYAINEAVFPAQQTGLEFYGSGIVGPVELGYHFTLSNGRGPVDSFMDFDNDKAVGARAYVRHRSELGVITLGASGYRGKYTDRTNNMSVDAAGNLKVSTPIKAQYDELSLATDLKWEREGFLFQAEAMLNDTAYSDRTRPAAFPVPGTAGRVPDFRRGGFYALTGYRFNYMGIMPWVAGEDYWMGKHELVRSAAAVMAGLNVRPSPRVVLKAQLSHVFFPGDLLIGDPMASMDILDMQGAWSF